MNDRGSRITHGIPVLHAQIVILEVDIQVGQDELRSSPKPEPIRPYIQDQLITIPDALTTKPKRRKGRNCETYLLPDLLPDDPRHLIPVQLDDGILNLDLGRYGLLRVACELSFPSDRRRSSKRVVRVTGGWKRQAGAQVRIGSKAKHTSSANLIPLSYPKETSPRLTTTTLNDASL